MNYNMGNDDMRRIKELVSPIPDSPYSWKMTSDKDRRSIVEKLTENKDYILQLDLNTLIEGELYIMLEENPKVVFKALRSIKKVMMDKYIELKSR